jgi:polygalacturonase
VYSKDLYIHEIIIRAPMYAPNVDGIDPDSCQNVRIIANDISCGDDHIAIKAGVCGDGGKEDEGDEKDDKNDGLSIKRERSLWSTYDPIDCAADPKFAAGEYVSRNITVHRNVFRTGMGIALGSELSGGIEDVDIQGNLIGYQCLHGHDDPAKSCGWGHAMHLKTTLTRGGFLRNIQFKGNTIFNTTGVFLLETDYQDSQHEEPPANYSTTDIRNITLQHNNAQGEARAVNFNCSPFMTCKNVRAIFNHFDSSSGEEQSPAAAYHCLNVETYVARSNEPKGLRECFLDSMNRRT